MHGCQVLLSKPLLLSYLEQNKGFTAGHNTRLYLSEKPYFSAEALKEKERDKEREQGAWGCPRAHLFLPQSPNIFISRALTLIYARMSRQAKQESGVLTPNSPPPNLSLLSSSPGLDNKHLTVNAYWVSKNTVFSQLDAHCVYLDMGLIDPAFKRGRRLIGAGHLFSG